ncbi:TetR/AcrR family transcriptional regulator [Actinomyces sp. 2119]|uniref:TetR/AcrR family transcriptional regulator n=1 Tax=Actinomyces lilanjuaniae TaxID=2321394 RepID=A0ABM6Z2P1_9ACTO|nr:MULTISPECIES: TetR/AcrR family transcriptional regulator [Actinomyces]AYD89567.1 TetR/AcrR family transcriptional regulator [Actinomyces lilanjuaniae]RJF43069.1 TetR/AcrR family transcriptional regulator [Actinomyces sp. 2119]
MPAARSAKPAPQRRTEILDAAQHLFATQGVQATSMEDILSRVGIAKGTLYYHFSSKEEILHALISRTTSRVAERARDVATSQEPTIRRFLLIVAAARVDEPERRLAEELHAADNAAFHVLSIVETVRSLVPVLTEVVEQGVCEGVFATEHPREVVEILLTSASMLLDEGIFAGEPQEAQRRAAGIVHAAETLLGCEPGALAPALERLS